MEKLFQVLESMRLPNGAYIASPSHDYSYVWIRDVGYTVLPYLYTQSASVTNRYVEAYRAILDLFKRYEWKIDIHSRRKPTQLFEYIHARYAPDLTELASPWGHAQNDAIGLFLWGIGEGVRLGVPVFRDQGDRRIVQKLVDYLSCLSYWQMPDNGMWEGQEEVHASSVGDCVAGLK